MVEMIKQHSKTSQGKRWHSISIYSKHILTSKCEYNEATFHGTNYPFYTYINSRPPVLPVQGQWTANTTEEVNTY